MPCRDTRNKKAGKRATYVIICEQCGLWAPTYSANFSRNGRYCSTKCYGESIRGPVKDYPCRYVAGSYRRGKQQRIREHRLVMGQHLGRQLSPKECIHHKNGVRTDNRLENLEIITRSEHMKLHWRQWKQAMP